MSFLLFIGQKLKQVWRIKSVLRIYIFPRNLLSCVQKALKNIQTKLHWDLMKCKQFIEVSNIYPTITLTFYFAKILYIEMAFFSLQLFSIFDTILLTIHNKDNKCLGSGQKPRYGRETWNTHIYFLPYLEHSWNHLQHDNFISVLRRQKILNESS